MSNQAQLSNHQQPSQDLSQDSTAPVFSSWQAWYGLVLGVFAALVGLMYWFSHAFAS
jgi:hypothetical protein